MTITPITDSASLLAPYEGRWSVNAVLDDLIEATRDLVCVSYIKSVEPFTWQHITGEKLDRCIRAATAYYGERIGVRRSDEPCRQIGVLSDSSFNLLVTQMALVRLGYGVVLISPNNSVPAVVHLLKATASATIVFSPEKTEDAMQARQLLQADPQEKLRNLAAVELFPVERAIDLDELPPATTEKDPFRYDIPYEQQAQEPAVSLHSSGSTGFPKPYTYS